MINIKQIHEKIRGLVDSVDEERYELRGKTKNYQIIQRYTRRGNEETEEVFVSAKDFALSLLIGQGRSTVTLAKDGKVEGRVLDEKEVEKIIDSIFTLLS